jgi:hypothetical protein
MDEDILTRRSLYESVSFCPVEPLDYAFFFHCPSPYELPTKDCDGRNQFSEKRAQRHRKLPVVPTLGAAAARTKFRNVLEPASEKGFETAKKSSNPVSPPDESVLWLWQDSNKNARKKAERFRRGKSLERPIPQCLCGRKGLLW